MYAGPSSKVMQNLYDPHINQSYRIKDHKLKLIKNKAQYKHLSECNKVPTLLTLLRILFLGRIGSISYVLPIQQNMDILNRDIRAPLLKFVWYDCLHLFWKIFVNFLTSTLLRAQNMTSCRNHDKDFFKYCGLLQRRHRRGARPSQVRPLQWRRAAAAAAAFSFSKSR